MRKGEKRHCEGELKKEWRVEQAPTRLEISDLSSELIELILSFLPISNLIRASIVCKRWRSIISSASFSNHVHHIINQHQPWLILHCYKDIYTLDNKTQTFVFDPFSNSWFLLPTIPTPKNNQPNFASFGNNGFVFSNDFDEFFYASIFHPIWHAIHRPLHSPLFDVIFSDGCKFIVGGRRHALLDTIFDMEIYDPLSNSWELGPPLPKNLGFTNLTPTALFKGKVYFLNKFNGFVVYFDLQQKVWSDVLTCKPPRGTNLNFLIAGREHLIIVGDAIGNIILWKVDEKTMEFVEISVMPPDLYCYLFDGKKYYPTFKCVGMGDLVYVLNEDYNKICVCEISAKSGDCVWRIVPPTRVQKEENEFYEVSSFCPTVSLYSILGERVMYPSSIIS